MNRQSAVEKSIETTTELVDEALNAGRIDVARGLVEECGRSISLGVGGDVDAWAAQEGFSIATLGRSVMVPRMGGDCDGVLALSSREIFIARHLGPEERQLTIAYVPGV